MQLQCNINEQTSIMVIFNVNFINDNINGNAINGEWAPLMGAINGSN
jgi:hypothetical protein